MLERFLLLYLLPLSFHLFVIVDLSRLVAVPLERIPSLFLVEIAFSIWFVMPRQHCLCLVCSIWVILTIELPSLPFHSFRQWSRLSPMQPPESVQCKPQVGAVYLEEEGESLEWIRFLIRSEPVCMQPLWQVVSTTVVAYPKYSLLSVVPIFFLWYKLKRSRDGVVSTWLKVLVPMTRTVFFNLGLFVVCTRGSQLFLSIDTQSTPSLHPPPQQLVIHVIVSFWIYSMWQPVFCVVRILKKVMRLFVYGWRSLELCLRVWLSVPRCLNQMNQRTRREWERMWNVYFISSIIYLLVFLVHSAHLHLLVQTMMS